MMPMTLKEQAPVPPPPNHRAQARLGLALHTPRVAQRDQRREQMQRQKRANVFMRRKPQKKLERQERSKTMRMQEPEQWQSFETTGATGQEYGAYRVEMGPNAQEQKISPQETPRSRVSVLGILTIVLSSIGFGPAIVGIVGSAFVLSNRDGSPYLLTGGILGLVGSIVALLLFVTIFVLSLVSAARSAARSRRPRFR